jgi:hypothetical protein
MALSFPFRQALAAAALLVATAAPAGAATINYSAQASNWLADQSQNAHYTTGGFPDYGLTADAVLGFTAAGRKADLAGQATNYLEQHVHDYAGAGGESYVGPAAKLIIVALARGRDAANFGGVNLVVRLQRREASNGRYRDQSQFGDFSNVITQSLGLIALERSARAQPSSRAEQFLVAQQCSSGGFPTTFPTSSSGCSAEADATGFALQALIATHHDCAATRAMNWLISHQRSDGSYTSSANGSPVPNANSTALASQALSSAHRDTQGPRKFLQSLAKTSGPDQGAIRYSLHEDGDMARATAQTLPALNQRSFMDIGCDTRTWRTPTC